MITFVLTHTFVHDYPDTHTPKLFTDRVKAVDAWRNEVLDTEGYLDDPDDFDPERLTLIGTTADVFLEEIGSECEWVCFGDGPVDEMVTIKLFAVEH